jgi:hypothetical protein
MLSLSERPLLHERSTLLLRQLSKCSAFEVCCDPREVRTGVVLKRKRKTQSLDRHRVVLSDPQRVACIRSSANDVCTVAWASEEGFPELPGICGQCHGCTWKGFLSSCCGAKLENQGLPVAFVKSEQERFVLVAKLVLNRAYEPALYEFADTDGVPVAIPSSYGSFVFDVEPELIRIPLENLLGRCHFYPKVTSGGHFVLYRKAETEHI